MRFVSCQRNLISIFSPISSLLKCCWRQRENSKENSRVALLRIFRFVLKTWRSRVFWHSTVWKHGGDLLEMNCHRLESRRKEKKSQSGIVLRRKQSILAQRLRNRGSYNPSTYLHLNGSIAWVRAIFKFATTGYDTLTEMIIAAMPKRPMLKRLITTKYFRILLNRSLRRVGA